MDYREHVTDCKAAVRWNHWFSGKWVEAMATRKIVRALTVVGCLGVFAGLATAGIETVTVDIPTTEIPGGGYEGYIDVTQFASGPERVLESVEIELNADFAGTMGIENTDAGLSSIYELELAWSVDLKRADDSTLLALSDSRITQGLLDPFDGVIDYAGLSGALFAVGARGVHDLALTRESSDLALFTGPGTLSLPIAADYAPEAWAASGSFQSDFGDVTFDGELTITYTYVPEPASIALLVMLGLALRRMR